MTDQTPPPAGWYPDNAGRSRWWDGQAWTDTYQDEQSTVAQPTVQQPTVQQTASHTASPSSPPEKKRRPWLVPTIVGVLALLVGVGIGGAGGSTAEDPKADAVKSSAGSTSADLDEREAELKDQASELDDKAADLNARESKVNAAEKKAKANTIEGDGNFKVGDDIAAGTWKNANRGPNCYWSINSDSNGENIVNNGNGGGPQTLTLRGGQYLELANDCGTWKKIG